MYNIIQHKYVMQYDNRILNESGLKSSLSNLPLLKIEHKIPFEHINADQVEPTIDILLLRAKQRRDDLINLRGPRTFENTMRVLDLLTEELSFAFAIFEHLQSVNRSDELKDNIKKVEGKVSEFLS